MLAAPFIKRLLCPSLFCFSIGFDSPVIGHPQGQYDQSDAENACKQIHGIIDKQAEISVVRKMGVDNVVSLSHEESPLYSFLERSLQTLCSVKYVARLWQCENFCPESLVYLWLGVHPGGQFIGRPPNT
jgi:hypothetical protein